MVAQGQPRSVGEDIGIVHRVVITTANDGYVLLNHGCYSLSTWAPVRPAAVQKRLGGGEPTTLTVRITTAALREVRVGDKFASRHGQKGTVAPAAAAARGGRRRRPGPGGLLMDQVDLPYTQEGIVPDILFARRVADSGAAAPPTATASPPACPGRRPRPV